MVQKQWWVKLLELSPVSGQWHQLVLVAVFVTATRLQLRIASFTEECLDCVVQVTDFMEDGNGKPTAKHLTRKQRTVMRNKEKHWCSGSKCRLNEPHLYMEYHFYLEELFRDKAY